MSRVLVRGDFLEILNRLIVTVELHQFYTASVHLVLASCINSLDDGVIVSLDSFSIFRSCKTNCLLIVGGVRNWRFCRSKVGRLAKLQLNQKLGDISFRTFGVDVENLFDILISTVKVTVLEEQEGTAKNGGNIVSLIVYDNSFGYSFGRLFIFAENLLNSANQILHKAEL